MGTPRAAGPGLAASMARPPEKLAVIVLAGGEARRFGSDKLVADVHGRPLLAIALDGIPDDAAVAVVGPERPLARKVTFLCEEPPGGGPAAGLIAGLVWALGAGAEVIVTLPGDAPGGGRAVQVLLDALVGREAGAVVGVDATGHDQVLQLALRPAAARTLVDGAGAGAGRGQSVHRLVAALNPPPDRRPLPDELCRDIDTADHLKHFRNLDRA